MYSQMYVQIFSLLSALEQSASAWEIHSLNRINLKIVSDIDSNIFFDQLGQELISTACVGLLERAFRCLGNDLTAFLTTLDGVNDVVQHESGSDTEAEFVCIATSEAVELHFTTDHPSIAYLLVGSLKGIARQFYNDKADVYILPDPYNTKFFR